MELADLILVDDVARRRLLRMRTRGSVGRH